MKLQRLIAVIAAGGAVITTGALTVVAAATPAAAKTSGAQGRIAFARWSDALQDTATFTVNPDGSDLRQLYAGASESPHWAPNGEAVAVLACADPPTCDTAAVLVDPDTGASRALAMPDPANLFTACVIWSPDSSKLACEGDGQSDTSRNGVYTISASDGGDLTRLTTNHGGTDSPLDYSPNGRQLLLSRTDPTRPSDSNQALFVVNADGSGLHRITPWTFSDDDASWSPNGTTIAFEHSGSLFTVHPDGTGLTKVPLAVPGNYFAGDFSWSPDGSRIVFLLGGKNRLEGIATARADGTDVRQVTASPTFDHQGDWGPHSG